MNVMIRRVLAVAVLLAALGAVALWPGLSGAFSFAEPTPTATASPTNTSTATATPTNIPTATATSSPSPSATATSSPTATATDTATPEPSATATATATPTPPPTDTSTPEPTATDTPAPTATHKPQPTNTPRPPTGTPTAAPPTATEDAPEPTPPTAVPPTATEVPPPPTEAAPEPTAPPAEPTLTPTAAPASSAPHSALTPLAVALDPTRPAQAPSAYDVYIPAATKDHQDFHFTCEFDAAWAIFKTYGIDVTLDEQLAAIGQDLSVEPTWKEVDNRIEIYGGDIGNYYSGDYKENFLARATGAAMVKVFNHFGLSATPVRSRAALTNALSAGKLVWIKTTVDFKRWVPATWHGPDGRTYKTVLGNDHAVVVEGFNANVVVIRDVLGPTKTNANRLYEYEVTWPTFMAAWGAQDYDGLAVAKP